MSEFNEDQLRDALACHACDIRSDADFEAYARWCAVALLSEIEEYYKKNPKLAGRVFSNILKNMNVLVLEQSQQRKLASKCET